MTEADIYVRISQDREGGGLGVERQEKDCRALAERLGWTVRHLYVDNDISAYSGKRRPDYEQLRENIAHGEVRHILAWHTDRLHRTPRELEDYIDASEAHGAITHTVKAGLVDLTSPGGRAMARTLCAWARYESDIKRERLRLWAKQRAENGQVHGGLRPFGWQADRITLDPAEHAVIVDCAERLLAGESLRSLTAELDRRGIRTVTGKPWSPTVLRAMLTRPRIAGLKEHKGQIVADAVWQPALDEDTWRELRALLTDPTRRTSGGNGRVNLLTGIARCAHCDKPLTIQYGGKHRPVKSRNAYGCKTCGVWRAQPALDDYITEAVIARLSGVHLGDEAPVADQAVLTEIATVRERLRVVAEEFAADDTFTPEQLRAMTRELRTRLDALERRAVPSRRRHVLAGLEGIDRAGWDGLGLDRQRAIVAELVDARVSRAGGGQRVFRPEHVELFWR